MLHCGRKILEAGSPTLALTGLIGGLAVALLAGCGQKGPLYIPRDDPAAAQRATLPRVLLNPALGPRAAPSAQPPASAASRPASAPSAAASAAEVALPDGGPESPSTLPDVRSNP